MLIDLQRLLRDAMPRVLDQAKLAQANAEIEKFKTRTGIDPRSFDQVAVGMRFNSLANGMTKVKSVALAHGSFNAGAMVAAGRLATNGKYTEEKYNGATIYVFDLNEQVKMFGMLNMKISRLGVSALNDHTLALGDPAVVRAAIDASRGGKSTARSARPKAASILCSSRARKTRTKRRDSATPSAHSSSLARSSPVDFPARRASSRRTPSTAYRSRRRATNCISDSRSRKRTSTR
jgi:hypothetical protein